MAELRKSNIKLRVKREPNADRFIVETLAKECKINRGVRKKQAIRRHACIEMDDTQEAV